MKKVYLFLLALISCSDDQPTERKPVVAVYAAWKYPHFGLDNIKWERFSHIAIASVYPRDDGTLESSTVDPFIDRFVLQAKAKDKQLILSVGGEGEASRAFTKIMANEALSEKFVNNLVRYAEVHDVDGIDIDWEYWTFQSELKKGGNDPKESQYLVDLLKLLRHSLSASILLSVDIAPGDWFGPQYKLEIQNYVDYVNVMAFNFTGAWETSKIAHHADYQAYVKAIKHTLNKGFDKQKLLIGLPTYGVEFIDGKNSEVNHIEYKSIVQLLDKEFDALKLGRYKNIYYDTKESFEKKSRYVLKNDLAGVFVFDLASDHLDEEFSLMVSLNKYIKPSIILQKRIEPKY
jgi:chitinase